MAKVHYDQVVKSVSRVRDDLWRMKKNDYLFGQFFAYTLYFHELIKSGSLDAFQAAHVS